jgi:hypothetical protein
LVHSKSICIKFFEIFLFYFFKIIPIVIYIFIADSFVNEIFGDNMIISTKKDMQPQYGLFLSLNFFEMMDKFARYIRDYLSIHCPGHHFTEGMMNRLFPVELFRDTPGIEAAGQYDRHP